MRKELEYAKKMTLIAKLYRMGMLSEKELRSTGFTGNENNTEQSWQK